MPLPWSSRSKDKEPKEPKVKEKMVKTGRGGAAGIKPASKFKTGDASTSDRDVMRSPKGREVSGSGTRTPELKLKESSKKRSSTLVSGDDDGGLVLIGKTGRGGLGNTLGRKVTSTIAQLGVRRPISVTRGLDLLAGDSRYSLRASASLYTLADTDETDMSHHITPFVLSDYDASTTSDGCNTSSYECDISISDCDASTISSASSSASFPSPPPSSASIYTHSSISSTGGSFSPFLSPSASSVTIHSQSPTPSHASVKSPDMGTPPHSPTVRQLIIMIKQLTQHIWVQPMRYLPSNGRSDTVPELVHQRTARCALAHSQGRLFIFSEPDVRIRTSSLSLDTVAGSSLDGSLFEKTAKLRELMV